MLHDHVNIYADSPLIVRQRGELMNASEFAPNQAFTLSMRPTWSTGVVVNAQAMAYDVDTDALSYRASDLAAGDYAAWILTEITSGQPISVDEFDVQIDARTPGRGAEIGAIWRACRALSPVAWDNLRDYKHYGDVELQRIIELGKLRVLNATVTASQEASLDPRLVDYIAKRVLVSSALPAVIDYWTNVLVSTSARGNSDEVKTYPDRIRAVENQILRFKADLEEQAGELPIDVANTPAPALINGGLPITPGLDRYAPLPGSPEWERTRWSASWQ